jgi:hypothetical protein
MKEVKELKKLAARAMSSTRSTPDLERAEGLKNLAKGFRTQAKLIKRNKRHKRNSS